MSEREEEWGDVRAEDEEEIVPLRVLDNNQNERAQHMQTKR